MKPYLRTQALARLEDTGTPLGWQNLAIKRLMGEGSYGEVFEVGSNRRWQDKCYSTQRCQSVLFYSSTCKLGYCRAQHLYQVVSR